MQLHSPRKELKPIMGMEDETREFLVRIVNTIAIVLVWMMVNVFIGVYKGYGFFTTVPGLSNYIYYVFFLISLAVLLFHLKRKWKL